MKKRFVLSLVVLTIIVCIIYATPKDFSSFLPSSKHNINGCTINRLDYEKLELDRNELSELLRILENTQFRSNGYYDNILVGNLYHIYFWGKGSGMQNTVFSMIISDKGIAYIGDKQYNISSKSTSVVDYLKGLY